MRHKNLSKSRGQRLDEYSKAFVKVFDPVTERWSDDYPCPFNIYPKHPPLINPTKGTVVVTRIDTELPKSLCLFVPNTGWTDAVELPVKDARRAACFAENPGVAVYAYIHNGRGKEDTQLKAIRWSQEKKAWTDVDIPNSTFAKKNYPYSEWEIEYYSYGGPLVIWGSEKNECRIAARWIPPIGANDKILQPFDSRLISKSASRTVVTSCSNFSSQAVIAWYGRYYDPVYPLYAVYHSARTGWTEPQRLSGSRLVLNAVTASNEAGKFVVAWTERKRGQSGRAVFLRSFVEGVGWGETVQLVDFSDAHISIGPRGLAVSENGLVGLACYIDKSIYLFVQKP